MKLKSILYFSRAYICIFIIALMLNANIASADQTSKRIPWIKPASNVAQKTTSTQETKKIPLKSIQKETDQSVFKHAFYHLMAMQHKAAIKKFDYLITHFPNSLYINDSYYWIAEATYLSGNYKLAVEKYQAFLLTDSRNKHILSAKLKIALAYHKLKYTDDARNVLLDVIYQHPKTTTAVLAKNQLHKMKELRRF